MPKYKFECNECGNLDDIFVSLSDMKELDLPVCDLCGGENKRVFGETHTIEDNNTYIARHFPDWEGGMQYAPQGVGHRRARSSARTRDPRLT